MAKAEPDPVARDDPLPENWVGALSVPRTGFVARSRMGNNGRLRVFSKGVDFLERGIQRRSEGLVTGGRSPLSQRRRSSFGSRGKGVVGEFAITQRTKPHRWIELQAMHLAAGVHLLDLVEQARLAAFGLQREFERTDTRKHPDVGQA